MKEILVEVGQRKSNKRRKGRKGDKEGARKEINRGMAVGRSRRGNLYLSWNTKNKRGRKRRKKKGGKEGRK